MDTFISLDMSKRLKGIAILMMVTMHLMKTEWMNAPLMLLDLRIDGESLSHILAESLHASTAIFAFLTGYAWGRQHYKKPLKKIVSIYISFWIVTLFVNFPIDVLDAVLTQKDLAWLNFREVLETALAISSNVSRFCWYISFYALAVITFPLFKKILEIIKINTYFKMMIIIVGFLTLRLSVRKLYAYGVLNDTLLVIVQHYNTAMPRLLLGVIVGQEGIFDSWYSFIGKKSLPLSIFFIVLLTIGRTFMIFGLRIESELDIIWIVFEMYALVVITNKLTDIPWIAKALIILGNYSLYIWLAHAVLLTDIIQPLTYSTRIPIVIVTIAVSVTLFIGMFMQRIDRNIKRYLRL